MKGFILALSIFVPLSLARAVGPPSPASLLPPLGSATKSSVQPRKAISTAEFDPIFDLEDPSKLLETDEQALSDIPETPKSKREFTYDNKLAEASKKLLSWPQAPSKTFNPLDPSKPLLPLLPLLATSKSLPPSPPHPPLLSAMTPLPQQQAPTEILDVNLMPLLAGAGGFPSLNREPTAEPVPVPVPIQPAQVTQRLPLPKTTALVPLPGVADIAVILANNQFFPSKIRLKEGVQTRIIFTSTNKKPAALVMERLQIQRWIAKEKEQVSASELDRAKWEVNRELSASKVTEVVLDPKEGSYTFHDAISGASGEIEVEKK